MNIDTKYHGTIDIEENDIFAFPNGLPGFLEEKEFILLPLAEEQNVYFILQSTKTPALAFVITNPFVFFSDYEFVLDEGSKDLLKLENERDVLIFVILNIKKPFDQSTANLLAPIILNSNEKLAKQVILHDKDYKTKHLLQTVKG
ncbi:flagellar assembly protein FliW [Heyndrickxia acidicola]|uniref:Flagellar assembly factor FliW n=1 Tax=Heyndrickxia acidicola TaxID=209389 RepID=A0ABU6MI86_9BACI|nr:flagellar assembly protein FliW [Heyndrickxia acidicola]MED1204379.1 flagellar assembly protein FliW [Heyndrickxia acidicola]